MVAANRVGSQTISSFNGLRTDTPPSKVTGGYSPDCSDMIFSASGMETRYPLRRQLSFASNVVWYKEFTCRNGSVQTLVLLANGSLYSVSSTGMQTLLDTVVPGCSVSSWTAYGREYMAFVMNGVGVDAPRQWDGTTLSRVTRGGPGAAPTAVNYALPASALAIGSVGAGITIVTVQPIDPFSYHLPNPPYHSTYYTSLLITTSTAHGFTVGETISITGNTGFNYPSGVNVSAVDSSTTFEVPVHTQGSSPGAGGTATPSNVLLQRLGNVVSANTATPHQLQPGYTQMISGIPDEIVGGSVTSITIDNTNYPGQARIVTATAHGLSPNLVVILTGVSNTIVGTSIVTIVIKGGIATLTTSTAHGLQVGAYVLVQSSGGPYLPFTVSSVASSTIFSYLENEADSTLTGGTVTLVWPGNQDASESFTVQTIDSATSFYVQLDYSNGTWTGGTLTFPWNGTFYVKAVSSPTQFTYSQIGPDAILNSGTGTTTPQGQIASGDHLICQHFLTSTGFITAPSPPVKFTASGNQYCLVSNLAIGPVGTLARYLSFTGANGSAFAIVYVPAQVNGLQVSSSTVVNDNSTTSVLIDFSDVTLLSSAASRIDVPGNNLFQLTTLNLPRGVRWYGGRMWWIGENNVIPPNAQEGFVNMGMDGGTLSGSTAPLGWTQIGVGNVTQYGAMAAYSIAAGQTGEISQGAATTYNGTPILTQNLHYSLCFWQSGVAGSLTATISSASTGFSSIVAIAMTASPGYVTGQFANVMPASIPPDMILDLSWSGLAGTVYVRDFQMIYADNPNRNPLARVSYIEGPESFDLLTGDIGPDDDSTALRALFVLQESMHFLTDEALYYVQQIGNAEPSSWEPNQVSARCGCFHAEAVSVGKGWAIWGGEYGMFRYQGGLPEELTSTINPTWFAYSSVTNIFDDEIADRVYIGTVNADGTYGGLVLDYHEVQFGGPYKWCPWNRAIAWVAASQGGVGDALFCIAQGVYALDTVAGIADDDFGNIGGYYRFEPIARSPYFKDYVYLWPRITGTGVMTPFLYKQYATLFQTLAGQELSVLLDEIAEFPMNASHARQLYLVLGQPGVQFSLDELTVSYQPDPNGEMAGAR